jgi:heavy metal sensor kinase
MNVRSISFRLVTWYAGLLAGIFLLLCAILYLDLRHFLENDVREAQLRRTHQICDVLLTHVKQTGEGYIANETKDWYEPEVNGRFIRITRANGMPIYVSGRPNDGSFNPQLVPPTPPGAFQKVPFPGNHTLFVTAVDFQSPGGSDYIVESGQLLDPVQTMLNHLVLSLILGLPLAVLIVAVGGYWLVRRALKPVDQITRAAERITQHNLSGRLPVTETGDQLERLSVSLNRMIARLDDAFQHSRRFVADASHELRTPLTILRGELETLAQDPAASAEWRDRAGGLLEEVMHLGKIVEQLFTLSKLDAGEAQTEWTRFDLSELAKTTAEQMSLLADDKGIIIACDTPQPIAVEGDRVRLKQVIVNLLDNAIKYTPEQGRIQLRVHGVNGHAVLEVEDNGIGIPGDALPHIFKRFYRVNQARTDGSESAGLGLSIVQSICVAHGAQVEAESTPAKGSCFRVKVPLAKN